MEQLNPIEKEFYSAITGHNYDPNYMDGETQRSAKAAAALCERKMNQWISVNDKLPESNGHWSKPILVYTIMDEMVVSEFIRPKNGEDLDSWLNLGSHEVTHWMPLPEPPKDLTEKKTT